MQEIISNLQGHRGKVGLLSSHEKTKAIIIRQDQQYLLLSLGAHDIEYVKNFPYFGSNIANTGEVEKDMGITIGKAGGVFQGFRKIWLSNAIATAIKLRLYKSMVFPSVSYAHKMWIRTAASPTCWVSSIISASEPS